MTEYQRLARKKDITARTTAELIGAAYGLPQDKSEWFARKIDDAQTWPEMLTHLPKKLASGEQIAEMIDELRKRRNPAELAPSGRIILQSVSDVAAQASEYCDKKKEYLIGFFLNARHQLLTKEIISIGTLTASLAHPREIFAPAIDKAAAGVILVHNHPSGDPSPSHEDMKLTKRISEAGKIMGIELLDHLIVSESGVYSFKQAGTL
jgi:DNA repair protein RadC